ncbi:hypothetical protein [Streptomyces sp. NPDC048473]|uniref:hypothetical protein n=1 Tax=unclassified Streptomyces TaxID=2593676 RepID=UPI00371EC8E8
MRHIADDQCHLARHHQHALRRVRTARAGLALGARMQTGAVDLDAALLVAGMQQIDRGLVRRPVPALVLRLQIRVTDALLGSERPAGHGTIDRIRVDLAELGELGDAHVLLDVNPDTAAERGTAGDGRRLLELLVNKVVDPVTGGVR